MKQEIEIEFKNLLTKQEYDQLLQSYPFPEEAKEQTNYYFETESLTLKEHNCALRIREKDGTYTMTLKEPHPEGLLETHIQLTKEEAHECIDGDFISKKQMTERLLANGIKDLHQLKYLGNLTTFRREVIHQNVLFVLDHSIYNGQEDYEFELEAPEYDIGRRIFKDTLQSSNIEIKVTPNKIERFFESLS